MRTHHQIHHRDILGKYRMWTYTLKTFTKCRLCNKKMIFAQMFISHHVWKEHGLEYLIYKEKYMNSSFQDSKKKEAVVEADFSNESEALSNRHMKNIEYGDEMYPTGKISTAEEIKVSSHEQDNLTDTKMPPSKQANEPDQTSTESEMGNKDERIYSNDPNMMCRIRCTICSR